MTTTGKLHATGGNMPDIPRPGHAECVKTLLYAQNIGTLSTQSSHYSGYPFGSMMPYALDNNDQALFLISTMAMHTQNIISNPKASLYITDMAQEGEPLGASRVTLLGDIQRADDDGIRDCYLKAHPNARYWVDFDDFSFYRLTITEVYFVGGFGIMGWVSNTDYQKAEPDILMSVAKDIIQHMNNDHADSLILLAKHQGGVDADEVHMVGVDRLGFDVKVRIGDNMRAARIAFPEPINNEKDVRSVFVAMVKKAKSA